MSYSSSKSLVSRKIHVSDGAPTDLPAPTGALCVDTDGPGLYQNSGTWDEPEWVSVSGGSGGGTEVDWDDVTGKPATFAPTIGTSASTAMAGNTTASGLPATAIGPGTATTVQGILSELASRISDLEADAG